MNNTAIQITFTQSSSNDKNNINYINVINGINCINDIDDNQDIHNYTIQAKICKRLSTELKLPEIYYERIDKYEPPSTHGLSNSDIIIPSYYNLHKNPSKIFDIDYYEMIKDDIRNYRTLNKYQLKYIMDISHEHKNELIDIFNSCLHNINTFL